MSANDFEKSMKQSSDKIGKLVADTIGNRVDELLKERLEKAGDVDVNIDGKNMKITGKNISKAVQQGIDKEVKSKTYTAEPDVEVKPNIKNDVGKEISKSVANTSKAIEAEMNKANAALAETEKKMRNIAEAQKNIEDTVLAKHKLKGKGSIVVDSKKMADADAALQKLKDPKTIARAEFNNIYHQILDIVEKYYIGDYGISSNTRGKTLAEFTKNSPGIQEIMGLYNMGIKGIPTTDIRKALSSAVGGLRTELSRAYTAGGPSFPIVEELQAYRDQLNQEMAELTETYEKQAKKAGELREKWYEALRNSGNSASSSDSNGQTDKAVQYEKKSNEEIYATALDLAKKKENIFEEISEREIALANKTTDETKKMYSEMAQASYKFFKEGASDGEVATKLQEIDDLINKLELELKTETNPEMITSLNEQLDIAKENILALQEVYKEVEPGRKLFSTADFGDDTLDKYWRKQRENFSIGNSNYSISSADKEYWETLTKGISTEKDLANAISIRKERMLELDSVMDANEKKSEKLMGKMESYKKGSYEYETARKEWLDSVNEENKVRENYNEVREELYNLIQLQQNWGKSIEECAEINNGFLGSEWREEEKAMSELDNMIWDLAEERKKEAKAAQEERQESQANIEAQNKERQATEENNQSQNESQGESRESARAAEEEADAHNANAEAIRNENDARNEGNEESPDHGYLRREEGPKDAEHSYLEKVNDFINKRVTPVKDKDGKLDYNIKYLFDYDKALTHITTLDEKILRQVHDIRDATEEEAAPMLTNLHLLEAQRKEAEDWIKKMVESPESNANQSQLDEIERVRKAKNEQLQAELRIKDAKAETVRVAKEQAKAEKEAYENSKMLYEAYAENDKRDETKKATALKEVEKLYSDILDIERKINEAKDKEGDHSKELATLQQLLNIKNADLVKEAQIVESLDDQFNLEQKKSEMRSQNLKLAQSEDAAARKQAKELLDLREAWKAAIPENRQFDEKKRVDALTKVEKIYNEILDIERKIIEAENKGGDRTKELSVLQESLKAKNIELFKASQVAKALDDQFSLEKKKAEMRSQNVKLAQAEDTAVRKAAETEEKSLKNVIKSDNLNLDKISVGQKLEKYEQELRDLGLLTSDIEKRFEKLFRLLDKADSSSALQTVTKELSILKNDMAPTEEVMSRATSPQIYSSAEKEINSLYDQRLAIIKKIGTLQKDNEKHSKDTLGDIEKRRQNSEEITRLSAEALNLQKQIFLNEGNIADREEEILKTQREQVDVAKNLAALNEASSRQDKQDQVSRWIAQTEKLASSTKYTTQFQEQLHAVYAELLNFDSSVGSIQQVETAFFRLSKMMEQVNKSKGLSEFKKANEASIAKLNLQIEEFIRKNSKMGLEFKKRFENLKISWNDEESIEGVSKLVAEFARLKSEVTAAGKVGASFFDTLRQRAMGVNAQLIAQYLSWQDMLRYMRQAVEVVKDLDYALIDLKKTTTMTSAELKEFYYEANDTAKQMGVTTEEIINQAAAWSRLGYSSKEAATEMAALSSQFAQISPGMNVETATDGLVSTMKAFHIDVANVESDIMDIINRTGNTMATTNEEIVEMLKRSSAAMSAANNSLKETIGLESAAVQITRNAETTGTAFRTKNCPYVQQCA